jgi:hypothetical protein
LLSSQVIDIWDIRTAITVSVVVACVCAGAVMLPGIDGRAARDPAGDADSP